MHRLLMVPRWPWTEDEKRRPSCTTTYSPEVRDCVIRVTPKIRDTPITVLLIHTTPVKPLSLPFSPARLQTALRCTLLPAPDALLRLRAAAASCGRSLGGPPSLAWTDASMQRSPATRKRARSEEDEVFSSATSSSGCAMRDHTAGRSPNLRRALSALLPRPRVVRPDDKSAMLRVLGACGGDAAAAAQAISSRRGFECVTARDLQRWAAAAASPRATIGRPVCAAFEAQVLALLVLEGNLKVVNTVYSYEVVRIAARAVQAAPLWAGQGTRSCRAWPFRTFGFEGGCVAWGCGGCV